MHNQWTKSNDNWHMPPVSIGRRRRRRACFVFFFFSSVNSNDTTRWQIALIRPGFVVGIGMQMGDDKRASYLVVRARIGARNEMQLVGGNRIGLSAGLITPTSIPGDDDYPTRRGPCEMRGRMRRIFSPPSPVGGTGGRGPKVDYLTLTTTADSDVGAL